MRERTPFILSQLLRFAAEKRKRKAGLSPGLRTSGFMATERVGMALNRRDSETPFLSPDGILAVKGNLAADLFA